MSGVQDLRDDKRRHERTMTKPLRALAVDEAQRQQAGWQALEALLRDVHQRPSDATSEQIEAEIGTARAEVKKARRDRSSH